jgi:predicted MPP superfamily phosphohydrolase
MYLVNFLWVAVLIAFHVRSAQLLLRRIHFRSRRSRRGMLSFLLLLILCMDLPLVHIFLFYKFYNPILLDQLMNQLAAPFIALHLNALLIGGWLLLGHYFISPLRRRYLFSKTRIRHDTNEPRMNLLKKKRTEQIAHPSANVVEASLLPALAADGEPTIATRRKFIRTAALAATGYIASSATLSAMRSTDDYRLERVVVKIPGLPEELKGTTIAMISDIHSSVFMLREEMERYKKAVNDLKADMIFVPGDFVNSKLREVYPFCEAFSGLSAPLGVYGVTGNHDYYTGQIQTVVKEVEQCGIRLLHNENLSIEKKGKKLWLLGMDDADIYDVKPYLQNGKSERGTIENLLKGIPEGDRKLLLCHKPYPFEEYSQLGVDMMFSGHTHGGQVVIAQLDNINLSFASIASKYVAGLYKARSNRNAQMYVTRGVGTVGIPLRLNCPPEITHFVLV